MAKYTIKYIDNSTAESDTHPLTLVNQAPSPIPTSGAWTPYEHAGTTVLEITTQDDDAAIVITPPTGSLGEQTARGMLAPGTGQGTSWSWSSASGGGLRLDMQGDATSTTFDIADSSLPPQALRVVIRRPT